MEHEIQFDSGECTKLLSRWNQGDSGALDKLIALIHTELEQVARMVMARERPDHTLQPSALVNEVYLRFSQAAPAGESRIHFLRIAARQMRQILIDYARARSAEKRGSGSEPVTLVTGMGGSSGASIDIIDLDRALCALAQKDQRKATVVELLYFAGLSLEETATELNISLATVKRDWQFSRVWLLTHLKGNI